MKKKNLISFLCLGALVFALTGCGSSDKEVVMESTEVVGTVSLFGEKEETTVETIPETAVPAETTAPVPEAERVEFIRSWDNGEEAVTLEAYDSKGNLMWTYETASYPAMQLDLINEIGMHDHTYYFVENGMVVALSLTDGSVKWTNKDFQGSCYSSDFGEDGTLYLCGYYGPDFMAIDSQGQTLAHIDTFDAEYYWAYEVQYLGDEVSVALEMGPDEKGTVYYVNLKDFSYAQKSAPVPVTEAASGGSFYSDAIAQAKAYHAERSVEDEAYYWLQYTLCDVTGDGTPELIAHSHYNKHGAELLIYADNGGSASCIGRMEVDMGLGEVITAYESGFIYEYEYKGFYELTYYRWDGSEFQAESLENYDRTKVIEAPPMRDIEDLALVEAMQ